MKKLLVLLLILLIVLSGCVESEREITQIPSEVVPDKTFPLGDSTFPQNNYTVHIFGDNVTVIMYGDNHTIIKEK